KGKRRLQRESFFAYFNGDKYSQDGDTVNYSNSDTGVYFHFTWYESDSSEETPKSKKDHSRSQPSIHFNMNFYRPHFFGLEAAQILTPFVKHFDLVVNDPQAEGMGQGDFTEEGFLRGWNAGNRFAAQAFRQMQAKGETLLGGNLSLPAALNRAY